ncbi:MAG: VCBS repeat-containing protein, partial [Gammaproteobacteria bacterium]
NVDVAIANAGSGNVSVILQDATAPGTFLAATTIDTGGTPLDVATGDIDGDGAVDLAIASFESGGSVFVVYQNPLVPGQFGAPVRLAINRPSTSVALGDIDGDGRQDLVATVQDADGSDGAVALLIQDPGVPRQFLAPVEIPVGTEPLSVRIADLDGDDRPDLVLVHEGPGQQGQGNSGVSVLLQDGLVDGAFLAPVTYAAGSHPVHVAIGDLDGDDQPDLVVANRGNQRGAVSVLLQDFSRDGVFLTATSYPGFYGPLGVAIGDLNDDGLPDIAAADASRATVLFQQVGSPGTFAAAVPVGD